MIMDAGSGDHAARTAFVARYEPALRRYIAARWRLPLNHEQVLDATQEAILECLKENGALSRVDRECNSGFRAFLYGVARNVSLRVEQRRKRRALASLTPDLESVDECHLSTVFDSAFVQVLVAEALDLLHQQWTSEDGALKCQLLEMNYVDGLPARAIAEAICLDVTRVYKLLHAARRDFRDALLQVLSFQHPGMSLAELEDEMRSLLGSLSE
jgi:RNA polymerase sigma factor (sigma-70 family)